jgi:hypothetical protein
MLRTIRTLVALGALLLAVPAAAQPPPEWLLLQNDPNPFCNAPGATAIRFAAPVSADVRLEVLSPDSSQVVRVLVNGTLMAGFHEVIWDGRDDGAVPLPDGLYPYRLVALDSGSGGLLFSDMRVATIACGASPTIPERWGRLKARYRDRE